VKQKIVGDGFVIRDRGLVGTVFGFDVSMKNNLAGWFRGIGFRVL